MLKLPQPIVLPDRQRLGSYRSLINLRNQATSWHDALSSCNLDLHQETLISANLTTKHEITLDPFTQFVLAKVLVGEIELWISDISGSYRHRINLKVVQKPASGFFLSESLWAGLFIIAPALVTYDPLERAANIH